MSRLQTDLELPSPGPWETAQSFSSEDKGKAEKEAYNSGKAATEIQGCLWSQEFKGQDKTGLGG